MSHEMERFLFKNHYPTSVLRSLLNDISYIKDREKEILSGTMPLNFLIIASSIAFIASLDVHDVL